MDTDEGPRRDTSPEALAKLKPAFHATGSVTAGNSSQTSDGAAAVIVMSSTRAAALGLTPLARFVGYATAGVAPELFGIGPVPAIRKALAQDRPVARRDRSRRAERGVRGADPRLPRRAADRSGAPQRQRRRHRPRPPARLHRGAADDDAAARAAAAAGPLRAGQHVRRRRHGRGRDLREDVVMATMALAQKGGAWLIEDTAPG